MAQAKSLVIVESPGKIRTINRYLGTEYTVTSSKGHIRDLPEKESQRTKTATKRMKTEAAKKRQARKAAINRMGVDPDHNWAADYQVLPDKQKIVDELKKLARSADTIYLATDLDREGEAIAWHLKEVIGGDESRYRRVIFNEITQQAVLDAFESPGKIDENRVNAQQARRFLDRVVGYELTPLLYSKVARGLSAGRVQSVAVRLIVEREREIRAFVPDEYWDAYVWLSGQDMANAYRFEVARYRDERFRPSSQTEAHAARDELEHLPFKVAKHETRNMTRRAGPPFRTSTMQQTASTRLGFSVSKTMRLAQQLYERGLITYMRTDSTALSASAVEESRQFIAKRYGADYIPAEPNQYAGKSHAQEAHEAIRPTRVGDAGGSIANLESDARRLYQLINERFLASQMSPARYLNKTTTVQAGEYELRHSRRELVFRGYTAVWQTRSSAEDSTVRPRQSLSQPDQSTTASADHATTSDRAFEEGESLTHEETEVSQHFTNPPSRYSEASLISKLDELGIGRPSTMTSIISTIQERGYATLRNKAFYAEKIGELVTDRLVESFEDLMNYSFTANMEEELDQIAVGERNWKSVLNSFYGDFQNDLRTADEADGMRRNEPTPTNIPCSQCGRPMTIRTGRTGVFLGCSGYSLPPKERCKNTINLIPGDEIAGDNEEAESRILRSMHRCPLCDTAMTGYLIDETRKMHICGNSPDCPGVEVETGSFKIKGYDGPVVECDKCGADMQLRSGRYGKYFACTVCTNTRKLLRNGEVAPPKADPVHMPELRCDGIDDYFVLRDGAAGMFLAASQFPKNRLTRAPLVSEIQSHANELDPKFAHLLTAPLKDPQGNPAEIRFARKTKQHYVTSYVDGKPTSWRVEYVAGRWVDRQPLMSTKRTGTAARKKPKRKTR